MLDVKKLIAKILPLLTLCVQYKGRVSGDYNNLKTTGIYYTQGAMTANKPASNANYGYILVLFFDGAMGVQIVIDSYGLTYSRAYAGYPLTWTTWKAH